MITKEIEKTVEEAAKWWGVKPRVELKYRYPYLPEREASQTKIFVNPRFFEEDYAEITCP